MADAPKLTPEVAKQIMDALKRRDVIVCLAKCWGCQFGQCADEPHTWMDDEDITHAGLVAPTTPEGWAALAEDKPCGCRCTEADRG